MFPKIKAVGEILKAKNKSAERHYFERVRVYSCRWLKGGSAFCLPGIGITVHPSRKEDLDLLRHEFGHVLQARRFGTFYFYLVIAPMSLCSAAFSSFEAHQRFWTETQANMLSFRYFEKPANWNNSYLLDPPGQKA